MKKIILAAFAALTLAGCNSNLGADLAKGVSIVEKANRTIAQVAQNDLPTACAIFNTAFGYYVDVQTLIPAKAQNIATKARVAADAICSGPRPTGTVSALVKLNTAWTAVQAATRVPGT